MTTIKAGLRAVYGVYAALAWGIVLFIGGALVLALPGLTVRRRVARWALRALLCAGVTPWRFQGLENVPAGPCVVIANHQSYLDGLLLLAMLPPRFSPVIKAEMGRVPIVGTVLRRVGAGFVRREPAIAAGRDTLALLEWLQQGQSLAIFPEGAFAVDRGLLPFRDGAFFMAAKAGVPVVPVGLRGAARVLPEGSLMPRPAMVMARVMAPASAENDTREAADALRGRVENLLLRGLHGSDHPRPPGEQPDYAFYCKAFADQALPFAYVDLDQLEAHIRAVLDASRGKRLRVDARVLRCPEIIERIMRSHARFHGVKCATVVEALYLAEYSELDDFLVAYPVVRPALMARVCQAIADGRGLTLTVDSTASLDALSRAAADAGIELPLCIEIDTSSALDDDNPSRRTAIRDVDALVALAQAIGQHAHLRFRGVLVFDVEREHVNPRERDDDERLRARRRAIVDALGRAGLEPELVDCAGAGRIAFNAHDPSVTEITVGAAFFGLADASSPDSPAAAPAAGYASEIMRRIAPDRYATLGGGYTAPDTRDRDLLPSVYLPRGAALDDLAGAGAGQLPIYYDGGFALGDMVFMHPANASELCERFDRLVLLQQGAIVGAAATYRALGDQFVSGDTAANG